MNVITQRQDAHWYDIHGNPQHTYVDKAGVTKPTTLREARKSNWLPSVTTFLKIFAEPGLNSWQRGQDIMSALTMPEVPGESLQDRAMRVQSDSEKYMREKAVWGNSVHAMVEQVCRDKCYQKVFADHALNRTGETFDNWFQANVGQVMASEKRVVSMVHGFAGTVDFLYRDKEGKVILADFKTPALKGEKKMRPHDKWGWQLGAYALALAHMGTAVNRFQSVILASDDPECIYVHEWAEDKRYDTLEKMATLGITAWRTANQFPWKT